MSEINAVYKVYNGTDFDTIYFKTSAGQVGETSTRKFVTDTQLTYIAALANGDYAPINSPTFTGTVTLPLTVAGLVKTDANGVITSAALTSGEVVTALGYAPAKSDDIIAYAAGSGLEAKTALGKVTFNHSNSITAQTTSGVYPITIDANGHITEYGTAITNATTSVAGFMSTTDKTKLDGIAEGATSVSSTTVHNWGYQTETEVNSAIEAAKLVINKAWLVGSQESNLVSLLNDSGLKAGTGTVASGCYDVVTNGAIIYIAPDDMTKFEFKNTTSTVAAKFSNLVTGDALYFVTKSVPDYWIGIDTSDSTMTKINILEIETQATPVSDNNPTLDWGSQSTVATIAGTEIHVTMPANPASANDSNPTLSWGSQSTVATVNGVDIHVTMPSKPSYTDTKDTTGATQIAENQLFLVGAKGQTAVEVTYTNKGAYLGTDGRLYQNNIQVVDLNSEQAIVNKTYDGYKLGDACGYGVDSSITKTNSTKLPTTAAVMARANKVYYGTTTPSGTIITNDIWIDTNN